MRSLLENVGIEMDTPRFPPQKFFADASDGGIVYGSDWDATFFTAQNGPGADISGLFSCDAFPPKGQNVMRFCNKTLDAWFGEFTRTYNVASRRALLKKEVSLIVAEVPTIVLSVPEYGFTYDRGVTGFHPGTQTPFDQMMNVDI
jgi:ABC-type transport system substrate-binding protein